MQREHGPPAPDQPPPQLARLQPDVRRIRRVEMQIDGRKPDPIVPRHRNACVRRENAPGEFGLAGCVLLDV